MKSELIINGAAGRMGRYITAVAVESQNFNIAAAVDTPDHPDIGKDAGILAGIGPIGIKLDSNYPPAADVMIDFSLPQATDRVVKYCTANNVALVIATTGLSDEQIEKIHQAADTIPIVRASNMSVGMNVLFNLVGQVANMLGDDYDIEITEAHHRFKKDSPSGSALTLAETIAKETSRSFPDCLVHGREGKDTLRKKGTIGMHAIRAGDITGKHSVIYSTLGETITLSHSAHSRDTFARGSIRAARWLTAPGREPGVYSMSNVLGM